MKKLILILAIALIASPALAVNVTLEKVGNVINVKYDTNGSTGATRMRAVALDLTMTGGTFDSLVAGSYVTGESNAPNHKGYGIYPARIDVNSGGVVAAWGTPLADTTTPDPGAGSILPAAHIVLEFGSLYYGDTNAPGASGTLCSLNITPGTASQIVMIDEDTYRGGLVMENGDLGTVNVTLTLGGPPPKAVIGAPANGGTKIYKLTDLSWSAGSGGTPATSRDVYFGTVSPGTLQGNQTALTFDTGTMAVNKTYYWRIDEKNSFGTTTGDVWSFTTECFPGVSTDTKYVQWNAVGKPNCWCAVNQPRQCWGDADGKAETKSNFWVYTNDLTVLKAAWGKNYATIASATAGTQFTPQVCADFDHVAETKSNYRVYTNDLTILKAKWGTANKPDPNCTVKGF